MCSLDTHETKISLQKPAEAEGRDQHVLLPKGQAHGRAISSIFIKCFKSLGPTMEKY